MDVLLLNKQFKPIRYLHPINIQWNRKYYTVGEYSIQILASEYSTDAAYVSLTERRELGLVQKIEYERNERGAFVQMSGFFAEALLNDKIFFPRFTMAGNIETVCRSAFTTYKADLPITIEEDGEHISGETSVDYYGEPLGASLYTMLTAHEASQHVRWDASGGVLRYGVWRGFDRTQASGFSFPAIFSQSLGTLASPKYTVDSSAEKNYFIGQANEESGMITEVLDKSGGGMRKIMYLDQRSSSPQEGQTEADFRADLRRQLSELAYDNSTKDELDVVAVENSALVYMEDFDLGYLCDIIIDDLQMARTARIIEVKEVWKSGQHTVEPVFGTGIPIRYRRY